MKHIYSYELQELIFESQHTQIRTHDIIQKESIMLLYQRQSMKKEVEMSFHNGKQEEAM